MSQHWRYENRDLLDGQYFVANNSPVQALQYFIRRQLGELLASAWSNAWVESYVIACSPDGAYARYPRKVPLSLWQHPNFSYDPLQKG